MNRFIVIVAACVAFISGCSVSPVTSIQTSSNLIVSLSGTTKNKYTLIDANNKIISEDYGDDGELNFDIPRTADTEACFHIVGSKGENLGGRSYGLPLINEFRKVEKYKSLIEERYNYKLRQYSELNKKFQDIKISLEGHSAFSNRRCHLPAQRPLPPMPRTRCGTYGECLEEGAAICYSRFIGTEGCSMALKELNVAGVLSSPGCAALAADLAGEKYGMEDAFVDALHGIVDDIGGGLLKSDSLADNVLGLLVLGANYGVKLDKARACTNNFVQHFYGPKMVWYQRVREIRLEPEAIKSNCEKLIVDHNRYYENLNRAKEDLLALNVKLVDLSVIHAGLSVRESESPECENPANVHVVQNTDFSKRYLIGAVIENILDEQKKVSTGVRVLSLEDDSPAKTADLRVNDVIVSVNNVQVKEMLSFMSEVQRSAGLPISIKISRNNKLETINVIPTYKNVKLSD